MKLLPRKLWLHLCLGALTIISACVCIGPPPPVAPHIDAQREGARHEGEPSEAEAPSPPQEHAQDAVGAGHDQDRGANDASDIPDGPEGWTQRLSSNVTGELKKN